MIRLQLRNAALALGEMLFELRVNLGRQVVFHEVREQAYEVGTAGLGHVAVILPRRRALSRLCDLCAGRPTS